MSAKRQKTQFQMKLSINMGCKGEALKSVLWVEAPMVRRSTESPVNTKHMMEDILRKENLKDALKRVQRNKGSPGIDGMSTEELSSYLEWYWPSIEKQLLEGTYKPNAVKRVEIPKSNGGKRNLGIPTVLDRFIQQAIHQVLQRHLDPTFSDNSFGFRPNRSAHQAVAKAQEYVQKGYQWVVDIDLEKFFDLVNHDILMGLLAKRISDKRVLKLIRGYLNSGIMKDGLVKSSTKGTPQGGPLSPLLSNLVLDVLDKELEKRGHRFVRYADDCNIYVKSERAGHRIMESITRFINKKLKLKVNQDKSAVDRPNKRKFLGFYFGSGKATKRGISHESKTRFKRRVRQLIPIGYSRKLETVIKELATYLRGWSGYYGFCETKSILEKLDGWIRRRLRAYIWAQWKTSKNRLKELRRRGVKGKIARSTAGSSKGPWRIGRCQAVNYALPNRFFDKIGLPRLADRQFT